MKKTIFVAKLKEAKDERETQWNGMCTFILSKSILDSCSFCPLLSTDSGWTDKDRYTDGRKSRPSSNLDGFLTFLPFGKKRKESLLEKREKLGSEGIPPPLLLGDSCLAIFSFISISPVPLVLDPPFIFIFFSCAFSSPSSLFLSFITFSHDTFLFCHMPRLMLHSQTKRKQISEEKQSDKKCKNQWTSCKTTHGIQGEEKRKTSFLSCNSVFFSFAKKIHLHPNAMFFTSYTHLLLVFLSQSLLVQHLVKDYIPFLSFSLLVLLFVKKMRKEQRNHFS